jgi:large subunit ribosomal protein L9
MKVILLQDVPKIGKKYDVKEVSSGYASNFLLPRKLADLASDSKIKEIDVLKKKHEDEKKVQADLLVKNIETLQSVRVLLTSKANEQGNLFQGIHKKDIVEALSQQAHITLSEDMIILSEPIKQIGEYPISATVEEKTTTFTLIIEKEE